MTDKAKKTDKHRLEIPTRIPQKPGIFDNIGKNRETVVHPVREILNFPPEEQHFHDAQDNELGTPTVDNIGRPTISASDARVLNSVTPTGEIHGRPIINSEDAHTTNTGRPTEEELDAQHRKHRAPIQSETGRPEYNILGARAPETEERAPKQGNERGALAPGSDILGAQDSKHRAVWEKNRSTERLALRPNGKILIQIKVFCAQHNYTLTEFFELAGLRFMELGAQVESGAGAMAPLNDLRLKIGSYKTQRRIINLYLAYTRRFNEFSGGRWAGKWLPRDDQIGMLYNEMDIRLIELGIMQTQSNKGVGSGKIQTFQYYVNEINATIETNTLKDSGLDMIVQHHREILERWFGKPLDLDDNAAEGKSA